MVSFHYHFFCYFLPTTTILLYVLKWDKGLDVLLMGQSTNSTVSNLNFSSVVSFLFMWRALSIPDHKPLFRGLHDDFLQVLSILESMTEDIGFFLDQIVHVLTKLPSELYPYLRGIWPATLIWNFLSTEIHCAPMHLIMMPTSSRKLRSFTSGYKFKVNKPWIKTMRNSSFNWALFHIYFSFWSLWTPEPEN